MCDVCVLAAEARAHHGSLLRTVEHWRLAHTFAAPTAEDGEKPPNAWPWAGGAGSTWRSWGPLALLLRPPKFPSGVMAPIKSATRAARRALV